MENSINFKKYFFMLLCLAQMVSIIAMKSPPRAIPLRHDHKEIQKEVMQMINRIVQCLLREHSQNLVGYENNIELVKSFLLDEKTTFEALHKKGKNFIKNRLEQWYEIKIQEEKQKKVSTAHEPFERELPCYIQTPIIQFDSTTKESTKPNSNLLKTNPSDNDDLIFPFEV